MWWHQGFGKMVYEDGSTYEGWWVADCRQGYGYQCAALESLYCKTVRDDKTHCTPVEARSPRARSWWLV